MRNESVSTKVKAENLNTGKETETTIFFVKKIASPGGCRGRKTQVQCVGQTNKTVKRQINRIKRFITYTQRSFTEKE